MPESPRDAETSIATVKLKGHQEAVLCLDHSTAANNHSTKTTFATPLLLLSGSEDKTCRLWDLRNQNHRASMCIRCPGEVLSVAFGPNETTYDESWKTNQKPQPHNNDIHTNSHFAYEYMIYTAVDNVVSGYDLRMATSPIVTNEIAQDVSGLRATDEINHISVFVKQPSSPIQKQERRPFRSRKKSNSTNHSVPTTNTSSPPMFYLATADDAGFVRVMTDVTNATDLDGTETEHMPSVQVYPHGNPEDAPAMVTSLAFCPNPSRKHPSTFLASGGTDCRICLWNLDMNSNKHPHHPVATITFDFTTNNNNNDAQICNPPFVHSLHWSPSGRLLAAGLGDGSIGILQFTPASSSLILSARMDNAHGNAVASCLFPMWRGQQETTIAPAAAAAAAAAVETTIQHTQNSMAAQDRLLCTAGNDGRLVFWDLGSILCGEKANDPMLSFFSNHTRPCDNVVTEWDDHQPRTLFAIAHGKKPNWLVSSGSHCCAEAFPSSVFVADVSSDITVYTIPTS